MKLSKRLLAHQFSLRAVDNVQSSEIGRIEFGFVV